jgi:hypothetical protein
VTDETGRTATGTLTVAVGGTRVETGLLTFAQAAGDEDTVSAPGLVGHRVGDGVDRGLADEEPGEGRRGGRVVAGGTRVETGLLTFAQAAGDEDTVSLLPLSGPWVLQRPVSSVTV